MKKKIKERFQQIILEAVNNLPIYASSQSDTTVIGSYLISKYRKELIEMGILKPYEDHNPFFPRPVIEEWRIHDKVLHQLNNLHRKGKVDKFLEKGEEGSGHNYPLIRWGHHAKQRYTLERMMKGTHSSNGS